MQKLLILTFVVVALLTVFFYFNLKEDTSIPLNEPLKEISSLPAEFILVDPEQAPPDIREQVLKGYRIVMNTSKYARKYTGNKLSCCNCHFNGGNTTGGRNGSISLVGVTFAYPAYSARQKRSITLPERINNCFQRSMNGHPLKEDCEEMQALLTYLEWISSPVKGCKEMPWLGLKSIQTTHQPDPVKGKTLYAACCASCHGMEGEGASYVPPLWGPHSFNNGAGMGTMNMMLPFVYHNMPRENPVLKLEEAIDITSYVLEQQRPSFKHD